MAVNHECKTSTSPIAGEMRMLQEMNDKLIIQLKQTGRSDEDVASRNSMKSPIVSPSPLKKPRLEQQLDQKQLIYQTQSSETTSPTQSQTHSPTFVNPLDYSVHSKLTDTTSTQISPIRKSGSSCNSHIGSFSSSSSPSSSLPDQPQTQYQQILSSNYGWPIHHSIDNLNPFKQKKHLREEENGFVEKVPNKRKVKQKRDSIGSVDDGQNQDEKVDSTMSVGQLPNSLKTNTKRATPNTLAVNGNVRAAVSTAGYKYLTWREKDRRRRFREEWKHLWLVVPHGRYEVMCLVCHKVMTQRKLDTIKRHTVRRHVELLGMPEAERQALFEQLVRQHNMLGTAENTNASISPQMKVTARRSTGAVCANSQSPELCKSSGQTDQSVGNQSLRGQQLRTSELPSWYPNVNTNGPSGDDCYPADVERLKHTARTLLDRHTAVEAFEKQSRSLSNQTNWFTNDENMKTSQKKSSRSSSGASDFHHLVNHGVKTTVCGLPGNWNSHVHQTSSIHSPLMSGAAKTVNTIQSLGNLTTNPMISSFSKIFGTCTNPSDENITRLKDNHSPRKSESINQLSSARMSTSGVCRFPSDTNLPFKAQASTITHGPNPHLSDRHNLSPYFQPNKPLYDHTKAHHMPENAGIYAMAAAATAQSLMRLQPTNPFQDKPHPMYSPEWTRLLSEFWSNITNAHKEPQAFGNQFKDDPLVCLPSKRLSPTGTVGLTSSSHTLPINIPMPNASPFAIPPIPPLVTGYNSLKHDLNTPWSPDSKSRSCNPTAKVGAGSNDDLRRGIDFNQLNPEWNRTSFSISNTSNQTERFDNGPTNFNSELIRIPKDGTMNARNRHQKNIPKMKECAHSYIFGPLVDTSACPMCIWESGILGMPTFPGLPLLPSFFGPFGHLRSLPEQNVDHTQSGTRSTIFDNDTINTVGSKVPIPNFDFSTGSTMHKPIPHRIPSSRSLPFHQALSPNSSCQKCTERPRVHSNNYKTKPLTPSSVDDKSISLFPTSISDILVSRADCESKSNLSVTSPSPASMIDKSDSDHGVHSYTLSAQTNVDPNREMEFEIPNPSTPNTELSSSSNASPQTLPTINKSLTPMWEWTLQHETKLNKIPKLETTQNTDRKFFLSEANCLRFKMLRLGPGQDLYNCLSDCVGRNALAGAFVVTCCGSLSNVRMRLANLKQEELVGPFEIVSLVGTVASDGHPHLHLSVANSQGHVTGGHLLGPATIQTTAEIVLGAIGMDEEKDAHIPDQEVDNSDQSDKSESENFQRTHSNDANNEPCRSFVRLVRKPDPITGFQELAVERI